MGEALPAAISWTDRVAWQRIPAAVPARAWVLRAFLLDGGYLRSWPGLGAAVLPLALLLGLVTGLRPGLETATYAGALATLLPLLLVSGLGGAPGMWALAGYVIGDLLLPGRPGHPSAVGAPSVPAAVLALGIGYLLLFLALVLIPVVVAVGAQRMDERLGGRPVAGRPPPLHLLTAALLAGLLFWSWANAVPALLDPLGLWFGAPRGAAVVGISGREPLIALVGVVAAGVRAVLEAEADGRTHRAQAAGVDGVRGLGADGWQRPETEPQVVPAARTGPSATRFRLLTRVVVPTALLAGLYDSPLSALLVAGMFYAVAALRRSFHGRLLSWQLRMTRVPIALRLLAVAPLSFLVARTLVGAMAGERTSLFPILLSVVVSVLLCALLLPARSLVGARPVLPGPGVGR